MKATADWRLYLVLDRALVRPGCSLESAVRAAAAGGITLVQLRHKAGRVRDVLSDASLLRAVTHELGLPLVIDDHVAVALAAGADGVHLGPEDMPVALARRLLGPERLIGVSAGTVAEARQAVDEGADYLGVGAVYQTTTKVDAGEPIGPAGLHEIVQAVSIPVVGIGGINAENVGSVIQAGAAGAATASAILRTPDVSGAARSIWEKIESTLRC
ncbi:MAG: thiamine phosphate synthase [Chloroflexota bacterium]